MDGGGQPERDRFHTSCPITRVALTVIQHVDSDEHVNLSRASLFCV